MSEPTSATRFLLGLRTTIYYVPDVARARDWYARLLGKAPYYDTPYYVGFNVGGFELGLHPEGDAHRAGDGGAATYWGVASVAEAWTRVLALGATAHENPNEVGQGIVVAAVKDPFGNVLGLIENPHFPNTEG